MPYRGPLKISNHEFKVKILRVCCFLQSHSAAWGQAMNRDEFSLNCSGALPEVTGEKVRQGIYYDGLWNLK